MTGVVIVKSNYSLDTQLFTWLQFVNLKIFFDIVILIDFVLGEKIPIILSRSLTIVSIVATREENSLGFCTRLFF